MAEPFFWGGQRAGKGYRLSDSDTTRFNALVWRRMYLSLFMFTGQVRTETVGDFTVIHLPYAFRNKLDPGSFPYPFWHSKTKWDSWQLSPELILVMEKGKITGALRSAERDEARRPNYVERAWDGAWRWQTDGKEQPYVTLYSFLFSPGNPHVTKLDAAYRAMESEMRSSNCLVCHSPDNFAKTGTLEFFNYPNQALYSRHSIVMHLDKNTMPPEERPRLRPGPAGRPRAPRTAGPGQGVRARRRRGPGLRGRAEALVAAPGPGHAHAVTRVSRDRHLFRCNSGRCPGKSASP